MKKAVAVVILLAFVLGACSQYTCPTYSKVVGKSGSTRSV